MSVKPVPDGYHTITPYLIAKIQRPLQNQFYGDRTATLIDPFGHSWTVSTHIEDVSHEEIARRMSEMMNPG